MKALVVNALRRGFDLEEIGIAAPMGREVLIDVQASGLCHTDLLFATHDVGRIKDRGDRHSTKAAGGCQKIWRDPCH